MSWKYLIIREEDNRVTASVETEDSILSLKHYVRHSPDGFEFGYSGSGPADLARSILIDYFKRDGYEESEAIVYVEKIYQEFKEKVISSSRIELEITSIYILGWMMSYCQELYNEIYGDNKDEV